MVRTVPIRKAFGRLASYRMLEMIEANPVLYDFAHDRYMDTAHRHRIWKQISKNLLKSVPVCKNRWKSIRDAYMRLRKQLTLYPSTASKCLNWHFWPKVQFLNICLDPDKYHGSAEALLGDEASDVTQIIFSGECDKQKGCKIEEEVIEVTSEPTQSSGECDEQEGCKLEEEVMEVKYCPETSSDILPDPLTAPDQNTKKCLKRKRTSIEESYSGPEVDNHQGGDALDAFFTSMALSVKKLLAHLIIKARMDICNLVSQYELEALDLPRAPSKQPKVGNRRKKARPPIAVVKCEVLETNESSDGEY